MGELATTPAEQRPSDDHVGEITEYALTKPSDQGPCVQARCAVSAPMNRYGAMALRTRSGHRTFHVVEYATPAIRRALARLRPDTVVSVRLVSLPGRGDTWRAVGVSVTP